MRRRNNLDQACAEALAGLTGLQALALNRLTPWGVGLETTRAAAVAAAVAALPPSLRTLTVEEVGACAKGAALVVPPGRAQRLELRCRFVTYLAREPTRRLSTGQAGAGDVRAFLGWLPRPVPGIKTLVLGAPERVRGGGLRRPWWPWWPRAAGWQPIASALSTAQAPSTSALSTAQAPSAMCCRGWPVVGVGSSAS
jgi:hypothetical protein